MTGFFTRLKQGLTKTRTVFSAGIAQLFLGSKQLDTDLLNQIETLLLSADVGVETTQQIIHALTKKLTRNELNNAEAALQCLQEEMKQILRPCQALLSLPITTKPYVILVVGINGSGKHNNWSLSTSTGKNLLSPGNSPKSNLQFLTFFVNTIKAVHEHADLMRASIASASNDHRLGANEAPPAIMSIFLGGQLSAVLDEIEKSVKDKKMTPEEKTALKLNIGKIPEILLDNTDRNRTSPFAFTGNKFEFRAVGSSANCGHAMTVLNTIVADQLKKFHDEVEGLVKKGMKSDEAILKVLRKYIVESKNIRFEGNGYGDEWKKEAKKRGLNNITTTPVSLDAFVSKKTMEVFGKNNIFNHRELEARHEIMLETYIKKIQIESRVMTNVATNHIIPAAIKYQHLLVKNVEGLMDIKLPKETYAAQVELIKEISSHLAIIKKNCDDMVEARKKANAISDVRARAIAYCDKVKSYFDVIRYHVDKLELIVDDESWPLPKYREMVTIR